MDFSQNTFDYHINWKSSGHHPGQHKSAQRGMGIEFCGHSTLLEILLSKYRLEFLIKEAPRQ